MKKTVKVICAVAAACVLAAGGYIGGHEIGYKSGQDSQISAMPKKTINVPVESASPEQTALPDSENIPAETKEIAQPVNNIREIKKQSKSSADSSWTAIDHAYNTEGLGTLTLYTSAQKIDDEIVWDDGQKWIVEVTDGNGGYFTLYDQYVNNGSVYYDVAQKDSGEKIINVYTMTGAGTTIKQYSQTENGFEEKEIYNSGTVNRVHSTVPMYE